MRISVSHLARSEYVAFDESTYDGAPDSNSPIGHGATSTEAIESLADKWPLGDLTVADLDREEAEARDRRDLTTIQFVGFLRRDV